MFIFVKVADVPLQNIKFHWSGVGENEEMLNSSRVLSIVSPMSRMLPISLMHSTLVVKASLKQILSMRGMRGARISLEKF